MVPPRRFLSVAAGNPASHPARSPILLPAHPAGCAPRHCSARPVVPAPSCRGSKVTVEKSHTIKKRCAGVSPRLCPCSVLSTTTIMPPHARANRSQTDIITSKLRASPLGHTRYCWLRPQPPTTERPVYPVENPPRRRLVSCHGWFDDSNPMGDLSRNCVGVAHNRSRRVQVCPL